MMMIVTEAVPPRLRGRLALWLVEIRAGVYVGNYSERARTVIWQQVLSGLEDGNAVVVWADANEAGYRIDMAGFHHRAPVDYDGIQLVAFTSDQAATRALLEALEDKPPEPDQMENNE